MLLLTVKCCRYFSAALLEWLSNLEPWKWTNAPRKVSFVFVHWMGEGGRKEGEKSDRNTAFPLQRGPLNNVPSRGWAREHILWNTIKITSNAKRLPCPILLCAQTESNTVSFNQNLWPCITTCSRQMSLCTRHQHAGMMSHVLYCSYRVTEYKDDLFLHSKATQQSTWLMRPPSICVALLIREALCIKPLTGHECEGRCQRN